MNPLSLGAASALVSRCAPLPADVLEQRHILGWHVKPILEVFRLWDNRWARAAHRCQTTVDHQAVGCPLARQEPQLKSLQPQRLRPEDAPSVSVVAGSCDQITGLFSRPNPQSLRCPRETGLLRPEKLTPTVYRKCRFRRFEPAAPRRGQRLVLVVLARHDFSDATAIYLHARPTG